MSSEERSCLVSPRQEKSAQQKKQRRHSSSSEEWQEASSSYSSPSSYSGSISDDSYFANWEEHVDKDGSLFYAEFSKIHYQNDGSSTTTENAYNVMKKDFKRSSTRRSNKKKQSKFMRFLVKKDAKETDADEQQHQHQQYHHYHQQQNPEEEGQEMSYKYDVENLQHQKQFGEIREIEILINPENRFKFGRRATATEALVGIITIPLTAAAEDQNTKLILSDHLAHSAIIHEKSIKIGDLLLSVNDIEVSAQNLNELLEQYTEPTRICMKFQNVVQQQQQTSYGGGNILRQITNFDVFVMEANELMRNPIQEQQQQKYRVEDLKQENTEEEMIFSLMVLNEDISDASETLSDIIFCYPPPENNPIYCVRGMFLTLNSLMKSDFKSEPTSTTIKVKEAMYNVLYLRLNKILFLYAISENYSSLKESQMRLKEFSQYIQFYFRTIPIVPNDYFKTELQRVCILTTIRLKKDHGMVQFENLLQGSKLLSLPKEAQLRIFDALSEMEAMDYTDWNDEPLNSHREFFIFGSALYFRSYLLVNQLPTTQLFGLEAFLRCRGIFDFIECQNVRDLVIWVEIPLSSDSRHFLVISSRNQLMLAVILQAFDPERRVLENGIIQGKIIPPSLFYIEEIQETLDHLRQGGIGVLAKAWIVSNKRPQVVTPPEIDESSGAAGFSGTGSTISKKSPSTVDDTSASNIPKRRSLSSEDVQVCSSLGGSSAQSLSHSEGSNQKLDDCDSDSDWEGFPDSHKSSSGFDMSEMTESLLKEVSDVLPTKITSGKDNILINYVHLDIGSGMILIPPDVSVSALTNPFREACHIIHSVLQNTKKVKRNLSHESTKPNTHKNLLAIKEHGILIGNRDEPEEKYWVIGRLFSSPPRELYVCHKSDTPQNLVEMAFRLSFNSAG